VKAYRSREVFMDTLLNSKICDESQIVSLYALREKLLLHVISRLGGSQVLCVCGEVEEIQASCRESAIPSRSPSPYTHVIELPTLNFKFPVSNTKIRQFEWLFVSGLHRYDSFKFESCTRYWCIEILITSIYIDILIYMNTYFSCVWSCDNRGLTMHYKVCSVTYLWLFCKVLC
jgi:hypothetical protein